MVVGDDGHAQQQDTRLGHKVETTIRLPLIQALAVFALQASTTVILLRSVSKIFPFLQPPRH